MSNAALDRAWAAELPGTDKLVLVYLADKARDREGLIVRHSQLTIASRCGLAERSVRYALRRLEGAGYLHPIHYAGRSSAYRVFPDMEPAQAGPRPAETPARRAGVTPAPHAAPPAPHAGAPAPRAAPPAPRAAVPSPSPRGSSPSGSPGPILQSGGEGSRKGNGIHNAGLERLQRLTADLAARKRNPTL